MTLSQYSNDAIRQAILTLENIEDTIYKIIEWNNDITSSESYYKSIYGMQLLAANCILE